MAELVGGRGLPEDVQERILMLLPTVDLLRGRAVCKAWLGLASHLLLARPPWLLLSSKSSAKQAQFTLACDVDEGQWYQLPSGEVPQSHVLEGCTQGLLIAQCGGRTSKHICCVGDPWTASWTQIQVDGLFTRVRGFRCNEEADCYTILASQWARFVEVTKVFKQSQNSWTTELLPCNPQGFMVERDGKFYSWMRPRGLMVYDGKEGTCVHLCGTKDERREEERRTKTLLICGGKLVRVCIDHYDNHVFGNERYVRVEQLCEERMSQEPIKWEEVGEMPLNLLDELLDGFWKMGVESFVGGTSYVCFRAHKHIKILTFHLAHRTWQWLPECPFLPSPFSKSQCSALKGMSLKVWPRLFPNIIKYQATLPKGDTEMDL